MGNNANILLIDFETLPFLDPDSLLLLMVVSGYSVMCEMPLKIVTCFDVSDYRKRTRHIIVTSHFACDL
jgi:hypothetical protein